MSAPLPPPSGPPVTMFPRPDPWAEQRRRAEEHRRRRRRRRRRWLAPMAVVGVAGAAFAVIMFTDVDEVGEPEVVGIVATTTTIPPTTTSPPPPPTVAPDLLVVVDDVWLLDTGDGAFDWGVTVRAAVDRPNRSGVRVEVRLVDDTGEIVETIARPIPVLAGDRPTAIAGRHVAESVGVSGDEEDGAAGGGPVRIEYDVVVGAPTQVAGLADRLDVRAVEYGDGVVSGRARLDEGEDVVDVALVLIWRDDEGDGDGGDAGVGGEEPVIGVVVHEVDRIRSEVDARFEIDLDGAGVPDRPPDDILWMP